MGEPIWLLWVAGLGAIVAGVLLFKYRNQAVKVIRHSTPMYRDPAGAPPDGSFLILPAIFLPPMGLLFLFFAADRTFGWGYT